MLDEWLNLREIENNNEEDMRPFSQRAKDRDRMAELADAMNKRMRGEL